MYVVRRDTDMGQLYFYESEPSFFSTTTNAQESRKFTLPADAEIFAVQLNKATGHAWVVETVNLTMSELSAGHDRTVHEVKQSSAL